MKRLHVHVAVSDLSKSVGFYSALFASQPSVARIEERNLFYVAPLLFTCLVLWIERGLPRPRAQLAVAGVAVSWLSVTNKMYSIERAGDLTAAPAFSLLRSGLPGSDGMTTFMDTNATGGGPFSDLLNRDTSNVGVTATTEAA